MNPPVIAILECTKQFRRTVAVKHLSLHVQPGTVYGLVGDNGAGKTTTIQMMLGLFPPTKGTVQVLGLDPIADGVAIKKRIGYVSENREMYEWMTVSEIIWFVKQFYPHWNDALVEKLQKDMELPAKTKIKHLSRGTRAKLALLLAMGHEPELLILDEPSSGLDPLVRREILEQVINLIQQEGRTVFFSSHLLDEVERVADHVGILCEGRLLMDMPLDELKDKKRRIRVAWDGAIPDTRHLVQVELLESAGREASFLTQNFSEDLLTQFESLKPVSVQVEALSLEDIFIHSVQAAKRRVS
ncbi:MAG: ABC transporter ATP-binding protein [bacterium]|jgi:ABC-2 type transport system ATP-binding protein|nr:ABC transporter ATP-binding protein [bacterium]